MYDDLRLIVKGRRFAAFLLNYLLVPHEQLGPQRQILHEQAGLSFSFNVTFMIFVFVVIN